MQFRRLVRHRAFLIGILVGVLFALTLTLLFLWLSARETEGPLPLATQSPTPSSVATPETSDEGNTEVPSEVEALFNRERAWSRGERLWFGVASIDRDNDDCLIHTYTYLGRTLGAFGSDCASWEGSGRDILLFYVTFQNKSDGAITVSRDDLVLVSRDDRSFGPVDVRSEADFPSSLIPKKVQLPPGANWQGYVTFDGNVRGALIPKALSYIDQRQTLTQTFAGKHGVE